MDHRLTLRHTECYSACDKMSDDEYPRETYDPLTVI
jgi:hypothetical protein